MKNLTQFANCGLTIGDPTNYSLNDQSDYHVTTIKYMSLIYYYLTYTDRKTR